MTRKMARRFLARPTDFSIQWRQLGDQPHDLTLIVDNAFNKLYIRMKFGRG